MVTTADLDKLQAQHEAATPGPWTLCRHWTVDHCPCGDHRGSIWAPDGERVVAEMGCAKSALNIGDEPEQAYPDMGQDGMRADARLIVAMRDALPELLAMARESAALDEYMHELNAQLADEGCHVLEGPADGISMLVDQRDEARAGRDALAARVAKLAADMQTTIEAGHANSGYVTMDLRVAAMNEARTFVSHQKLDTNSLALAFENFAVERLKAEKAYLRSAEKRIAQLEDELGKR